jgi:Proteins containing SET domain
MDLKFQKSESTETNWLIFKESPIHGLGGFAKRDILAGTRVIEYLGEKIDKQESLRRCEANNQYIFALNEREDLDGNVDWNPARFINHSCAPNCEIVWDGSHLWLDAMRNIKAGEEITFNYGYDLVDYREYPCACGSAECVGFIVAEAFFETLRAKSEIRNSKFETNSQRLASD